MVYFFKIRFTETKQCSAIHFTIAANIIMNKRFEGFIIFIIPIFVGTIAAICYHFMWIPVFFFLWNETTTFKDQNSFPGWCKFIGYCTATAPGADDDDVVMIGHDKIFRYKMNSFVRHRMS